MKSTFLFLLFLVGSISTAFSQTYCGFTQKELEEFGAWICPEYIPSPGFPGSSNPAQLNEVVITRPSNDTSVPGFPITVTTPTYVFHYNYLPCPGDPAREMSIAPSRPGNYKGGTYGNTRNQGTKFHDGVDIASPRGANLYSMHAGTVTGIRNSFSPGQYKESSYGNYITIQSVINGVTISLKYNHLDGVNTNLMVGSGVAQGAYIGISGNTGNAATAGVIPHVHIQGRNASNAKIDPLPYFGTQFNINTGVGTRPCP